VHAETGQAPIGRFEADGPHRQAGPALLAEAFRWSVTRKVTRTATVPPEGNSYAVDPALTGRRILLVKHAAQALVDVKRIPPAPGRLERLHEHPVRRLVVRAVCDQRL
jgi:hypothetical protein